MTIKVLITLIIPLILFKGEIPDLENYQLSKLKNGCLVLKKEGKELDKLCLNKFDDFKIDKNQILELIDSTVIRVELKTGAIDNFSEYFYLIERLNVEQNKFNLISSSKVYLRDYSSRKISLSLTENGVKWKYRRGLFKKPFKGIIQYSKLKTHNNFDFPISN